VNQHQNHHENEELLKRLLEVEAAIKNSEREIAASEKRIDQIKKSNTYKRTGFLRKLFKSNSTSPSLEEIQKELLQVKESLIEAEDTLAYLKLKQETYDYDRIWRMMRESKTEGEIIDLIESVIKDYRIATANYVAMIHATARLFMDEKEAYRKLVYPKLLSGLHIEDIPEFMVRSGFSDDQLPLKDASSFRASLTMRMREYQLHGSLPEMILDDKKTAYQFAEMLNIPTPELSEENYSYDEIPEATGVAIKPVDGAGARGVYLVYGNDDIIDIKQSKKIANWHVLRKDMERDLISGRVSRDEWFTEELIFEDKQEKIPARDIKFYCFYGKVGLILEIIRYPELEYCWWTATGKRIATGKYEASLFKGKGVTEEEIQGVERISREIPAPFIRIDFLRSDTGLIFGEFTPKPGNYDEFNRETDQWLGDYFLEAQGRLTNDLLNGKEFNHFKNLTRNSQ
jgi:hypothetical protein